MSLNKKKIEKTIFSLKYFNIVKNLNDNYINYIKSYLSVSKDFYSQLINLQKDNEAKTKEILNKIDKNENSNFFQIIKLMQVFPKIYHLHLENLGILLGGLEKEISPYTNFVNEKEAFVYKLVIQFNEAKIDYLKKEEEINKLKTSFLNNMNNSEEIIYKFYSSQKEKKEQNKKNTEKKKKNLKKKKEQKKKNSEKKKNILNNIKKNINLDVLNINKNIITEEQVNNSINNTKKIENNYKEIIETGKMFQDTYIQTDNSSSENIKIVICDIFLQLKKTVMNSLMSLKNIFTIPDKEITNYLSELLSDKEKKKIIEEAMDNFFANNNIEKKEYIPKMYDLKVLEINNESNENKKKEKEKKKNINLKFLNKLKLLGNKNESKISKGEAKISIFEDGLEEMPFIKDEVALLTTKKMINNFKLINDRGFKLNIEEEKTKTNKLSEKIVSTFQKTKKKKNSKEEDKKDEINNNDDEKIENNDNDKDKDDFVVINDTEIISITEEEIKLFESLLDKHHNRIIFLQKLNEFRATGRLIIPKKSFEMMGKFFNIILDKVKRDNDIHSYKNIILLSQTYYALENGNKKYIQELLIDNEIFKDKQFWEDLLNLELGREFKRLYSIEEKKFKNENIEGIKEIKSSKIGNLVFSQIISICDNMISFGVNKETLYEIIEPNFKRYQLSQDIIDNIKEIVQNRFEEEKKI